MLQLLIVEDEADLRESLVQHPWSGLGIRVAAACEHGMEALQVMETQPIDLVLTDIRMPIMDGLELVRRVREHYPYTRVVVLSGYDDFQYAQTCMHYGVSEYLLKPVFPDQLHATINNLKQQLIKEEKSKRRSKDLERKSELLVRTLRREFMERLLSKPLPDHEVEDGCTIGEMLLDGHYFVASALRLDRSSTEPGAYTEEEWKLIHFALSNIIAEIWDDEGLGYHYVNKDSGTCYLVSAARESLPDDLMRVQKQLYRFRGLLRSTLSVSIGTPVPSLAHICKSRQIADKRLLGLEEGSFDAEWEYDPVIYSYESANKNANTFSSSSEHIVNKAKEYIIRHYQKPITLSEVADAIHVNGSYLSHLFTEVTGETYVQYLSSCRIERAKELLENKQLKVYEIGEMVGYQNPRYFSVIFCKFTGMTPNEYRSSRG